MTCKAGEGYTSHPPLLGVAARVLRYLDFVWASLTRSGDFNRVDCTVNFECARYHTQLRTPRRQG